MWGSGKELLYTRAERLYQKHALFNALWDMGHIVFSEEIPTACITFDKATGSELSFVFNPKFWDSLSEVQKDFVICHEMIHIIYGHGRRMFIDSTNNSDVENIKKNFAADIVVNETLVKSFGFFREEIDPEGRFCWLDTVFKGVNPMPVLGETYEYYYNKINQNEKKCLGNRGLTLVDVHMPGMGEPQKGEGEGKGDSKLGKPIHELPSDMVEKLKEAMSDESIDKLEDTVKKHNPDSAAKQAGSGHHGKWVFANVRPIKPNRKFENIIRRKIRALDEYKDEEDWKQRARRTAAFNSPDVFLPGSEEVPVKGMIDLVMFLDCSGSCAQIKSKFLRVARSIDRSRFRARACVFDTRVKEFNPWRDNKVMLGGGTSFHILEDWIQTQYKGYPDAVFVFTDGYGDRVTPEKPKNWVWFLSDDYRQCYPTDCKTFMLDDIDPKWRTYD